MSESIDLDAIRARAEAATAGPWEATTSEVTMNDSSGWRIGDRSKPMVLFARMRSSDAEFIAAARSDIPTLLAEVERQRILIAALDHAGSVLCAEVERLTPEMYDEITDHPRDPADCPVCRDALGLPEPVDVAGEAGQRLPSDLPTAPTQVDADSDALPSASAFPMQWEAKS